MFHWICPECGREIAPTVRECPVCDGGAEQPELVLAGVVEASARTLQADASGAKDRGDIAARRPGMDSVPGSSLPELVKWARAIDDRAPARDGLAAQAIAPVQKPIEEPSLQAKPVQTEPAEEQPVQERSTEKPHVETFAEASVDEVSKGALTPEILDSKSAHRRSAEAKAAGIMGILTRTADNWVRRPGAGEAKPVTTRTVESRAVESRSVDAKPAEVRSIDAKPIDAKPIGVKPMEAKQVESLPAASKPVESTIAEGLPVETRSVETALVEPSAVPSKSAENPPVDATPIEIDPVEEELAAVEQLANQSPEQHVEQGREQNADEKQPLAPVEPEVAASRPADSPFDRIPLLTKLSRLALPKIAPSPGKESPKRESVSADPLEGPSEKIDTAPAAAAPLLPSTPSSEPRIAPAIEIPIETSPASIPTSGPGVHDSDPNRDLHDSVKPETVAQEPVLPAFAAPDHESLNALLDAVGMLDEDHKLEDPDPPAAGQLALPMAATHLPAVAPTLVSIGAIEPRALTATTRSASELVNDVTTPAFSHEHRIAGLGSANEPFPLPRPSAQTLKSAARQEPVPQTPRAGAVRSPRSPAPFLAPDPAGLTKYDPLENRPIQAIAPPADLRKSGTAPRITLPGPMLTRALVSFVGREFTPIFLEARPFRKRFAYGWVAAVLAVGTILGVGFSSIVSPPGRPPVEARASSDGNPAESNPEATTPMNAPVQATGANPLSKMIEVTGFRIVLDPSRKPQVEYLVVNHSSARFPDATIYVSLRTANAHVGQAPLCRFSFAAPDLGPYEAKEMISAIEKTNRAINLPEWQDLRAEIEIGQ